VCKRIFVIVSVLACGELLQERLQHMTGLEVIGVAADGEGALRQIETFHPQLDIVVLDVGTRLALETAHALRDRRAAIRLVAIGLDEEPAQVLSWAVAGATGLAARTASLDELLSIVTGVARGEAPSSPGVSGALLRGVGSSNSAMSRRSLSGGLTDRQWEVARLVGAGFTNKEIAAHLQIEPGTVKSHVHSIIQTLGVSRRSQVAAKLRRDGLISEWSESPTDTGGRGSPPIACGVCGAIEAGERPRSDGSFEAAGAGSHDAVRHGRA
jgi:DNA-binding NarL/FixJ family response regulator